MVEISGNILKYPVDPFVAQRLGTMMNNANTNEFSDFPRALSSADGFTGGHDSPGSYAQRVEALIESAQYAKALQVLDVAIALNSADYQAWILRGVVLVYLERYCEAIDCFDRALVYQPDHSEAWKFRGIALHGLNRYREAYESYERALGIVRSSWIESLRQWVRQKLGKHDSVDYQALML